MAMPSTPYAGGCSSSSTRSLSGGLEGGSLDVDERASSSVSTRSFRPSPAPREIDRQHTGKMGLFPLPLPKKELAEAFKFKHYALETLLLVRSEDRSRKIATLRPVGALRCCNFRSPTDMRRTLDSTIALPVVVAGFYPESCPRCGYFGSCVSSHRVSGCRK